LLVVIGGTWALQRGWRRLPGQAAAAFASEAYRRGRFGESIEAWSRALDFLPARLGPTAVVLRGMARLRLWQLARATEDLEAGRRIARLLRREWLGGIDAELALAAALLGAERTSTAQKVATLEVGHGALIEALVQLGQGAFQPALEVLRSPEARQCAATLGELVRVLAAWCVFELHQVVIPVDASLLFREGSGGELLAAWPGLARFLDSTQTR
ncbi:MAG: hypothetical protein ABTQ32_37030, partial [Myxococcaceae bacterium]